MMSCWLVVKTHALIQTHSLWNPTWAAKCGSEAIEWKSLWLLTWLYAHRFAVVRWHRIDSLRGGWTDATGQVMISHNCAMRVVIGSTTCVLALISHCWTANWKLIEMFCAEFNVHADRSFFRALCTNQVWAHALLIVTDAGVCSVCLQKWFSLLLVKEKGNRCRMFQNVLSFLWIDWIEMERK